MRFRATILQAGKTATGIQVPDQVVTGLGASKRPAVRVTFTNFNDFTYRTTVAAMGGVFMIPISAEIRKNAGVAGGDEVDVSIELDDAPREVTVPADFTDVLNQDPVAKARFNGLSYSNQLRHVLSIEDAKTPETRQRRLAKTIDALRAG